MDRFGDKVCSNPTVKLNKQEMYPLIDIDKINPGYKTVRSVLSVEYTGQSGAKFQDHDILFARITPCLENGKVAIAETDGQNGIGSTELFVFRGRSGVSDTDYIYYLLQMKHIRQLAANSMTGASGRQRADLGFIKRIQWNFPKIEVQERIASILSYGLFFKDESFSDEKEYRIVIQYNEVDWIAPPLSSRLNSEKRNIHYGFYERNGIIVPCLNVPLSTDAVKKIRLAPILESHIASESMKEFLGRNGYSEVDVKQSTIPIRY